VYFPEQFEFEVLYDTTDPRKEKKNKETNYVKWHVQIDGKTNKAKVTSHFSALGLKPQEVISMIIDFNEVS